MPDTPRRDQIGRGTRVLVQTKADQGTDRLTAGTVAEILTSSRAHPYGIKVMLQDGQVGRVKRITEDAAPRERRAKDGQFA